MMAEDAMVRNDTLSQYSNDLCMYYNFLSQILMSVRPLVLGGMEIWPVSKCVSTRLALTIVNVE